MEFDNFWILQSVIEIASRQFQTNKSWYSWKQKNHFNRFFLFNANIIGFKPCSWHLLIFRLSSTGLPCLFILFIKDDRGCASKVVPILDEGRVKIYHKDCMSLSKIIRQAQMVFVGQKQFILYLAVWRI